MLLKTLIWVKTTSHLSSCFTLISMDWHIWQPLPAFLLYPFSLLILLPSWCLSSSFSWSRDASRELVSSLFWREVYILMIVVLLWWLLAKKTDANSFTLLLIFRTSSKFFRFRLPSKVHSSNCWRFIFLKFSKNIYEFSWIDKNVLQLLKEFHP